MCHSFLDFTFPNHQMDQDGDEAHWEEREGEDHAMRCVLKLELSCSAAVLEVVGVDVEEEVLSGGVWIKAATFARQQLQAKCHVTV